MENTKNIIQQKWKRSIIATFDKVYYRTVCVTTWSRPCRRWKQSQIDKSVVRQNGFFGVPKRKK